MIMKTWLSILLMFLLSVEMGCVTCNDCNEPRNRYRYVNTAEYPVKLETRLKDGTAAQPDGEIRSNDTLLIEGDSGFLQPFRFYSDSTITIKLEFMSIPKRCYTFEGSIPDKYSDMRSVEAYMHVDAYTYLIEESHYNNSETCQ